MNVTVDIAGEDSREVHLDGAATYRDLLAAVDRSPQAVSVLVDGSPVPEDQPVEADHVRVIQLIKGG